MSPWPSDRLDALADTCLGKMLDKQKNRGTMRPYLRNASVRWGTFDLEDVQLMPFEEDELERYSVRAGDLVICEGGEPGRCAIWTRPTPFYIQKALHRVRCGPKLSPGFLAYWIRHLAMSGTLAKHFTGTTIGHLPGVVLAALEVPHPPVPEQGRIVAAIDTHFSRIDAVVATLDGVKANLKRARASVLKAAVEGRLVPTEAALAGAEGREFEPASQLLGRVLAERKAAWIASGARGMCAEPANPETQGLPVLPEGWAWATIQQLSDSRREPTYGVVKLGDVTDGGVPVLRSSNVRGLHLDLSHVKPISPAIESQYARTRLQGGEVLVTVRGTLGGVVVAPPGCVGWNVSREVAVVVMQFAELGPFTAVSFKSPVVSHWMAQRLKGIAYTGLNIETLKEVPIPLPPLAEQNRIVAEVDRRLSVLDAIGVAVDANLVHCTRLRQSILKRAFEGRLVPPQAES